MVLCPPGISLTRTHYELYTYRCCVAQTAHDPDKVSFALLSVRICAIGLCFHLIIQGDTVLSHHVFWSSVPPFSSPMLDHCSQGRVRTKSGSSYKCQPEHLWSCRVVTSMKYEATISSSR